MIQMIGRIGLQTGLLVVFLILPDHSRGQVFGGHMPFREKEFLWISLKNENPGSLPNGPEEKNNRFPPFWCRAMNENGFDLPKSFGAAFNFMAMNQTNQISNLVVSARGIEVPFDVQFYNTRSIDMNATLRMDVWVLPFINAYGIFGYTSGKVSPDIRVPAGTLDVPFIGQVEIESPITIQETLRYFGSTFGYGLTMAAGFKRLFASLDFNQTWTDLNIAAEAMVTHTLAPRVGAILDASMSPGQGAVWIGGMYVRYRQTFLGTIAVVDVDPGLIEALGEELKYTLDLGNRSPWNLVIGGSWIISGKLNLMVEAGLGDRYQVLTAFSYRF
jgi:hypothetical protein